MVFHPDWRIVGAIGYLWFDIAVLFACFAAACQTPPLAPVVLAHQIAHLSNVIPVPGGIGVLDCSIVGMLVLYGVGGTVATAATLVYHAITLWVPAVWGRDCIRRAAEDQEAAGRPAQPDRGTPSAVRQTAPDRHAVTAKITAIRRGQLT